MSELLTLQNFLRGYVSGPKTFLSLDFKADEARKNYKKTALTANLVNRRKADPLRFSAYFEQDFQERKGMSSSLAQAHSQKLNKGTIIEGKKYVHKGYVDVFEIFSIAPGMIPAITIAMIDQLNRVVDQANEITGKNQKRVEAFASAGVNFDSLKSKRAKLENTWFDLVTIGVGSMYSIQPSEISRNLYVAFIGLAESTE